jgi:serine/threonine protein phosphatase 1
MTTASRRAHHWVIGDVHGCDAALDALLQKLPSDDRLIFCGDAINRGPNTPAVMERIWELVESGRAVWLRGNHEQDLINALQGESLQHEIVRELGPTRAQLWLRRLSQLPMAYWGEGWVATHAGFDPSSWQPDLRVRMGFWQNYDGRFGDVVIGHTPGPQVRHLPQIVMVDTGACYGGDLSAYCPETRTVISVPGLQPSSADNLRTPSLSRC